MKLMIRKTASGALSAYAPKKDLEEPIVEHEHAALWGGWVKLKNGWIFQLPDLPADTRLPITITARKLGGEED
ncbi:MAG: putative nitrogen fixation protein NifT [Rhizobiales bacterium 32-66-8]|nr:MAG: putative nitrogen fixation protein NifT [Rhizobiales bacterium 32-66-8]